MNDGILKTRRQRVIDTVRRASYVVAGGGLATVLMYIATSGGGAKQALLDFCCSKHPVGQSE
jgi:hypothetical protein